MLDREEQKWVNEVIAEKKDKEETEKDIYSAINLFNNFIKKNEK